MIVFIDIDGVLCDLTGHWLSLYNADYGDCLTSESLTQWDIAKDVKPECGAAIWEYLHKPDLYDGCEIIPGALEGVQAIRDLGHRAVFATAANVHQAGNKLKWLERHGFLTLTHGTLSKDYVEIQDKSLLRGECLIDDGIHNLEGFQGEKILFGQPHNRTEERFLRVSDWTTVPSVLKALL